MIKCLSVQYPVKDCSLALNVSRSGYYQWTEALPCARALEERELFQELEKLFKENRGRYGSPRMTRARRENGYRVGKNRVARLMRERTLLARKKRAFRPKTTRSVEVAVPNHIADLEALAPDQIWVSDIT
jgi:putative transposase